MIFIDTSYYFALINHKDSTHDKAVALKKFYINNDKTSTYAVLSELATIGSQRFSRTGTINFIENLLQGDTEIILESEELMEKTWQLFKNSKSKNISWVDCYSVAICHEYDIKKILTFDKDIPKLQRLAKKLFA
ncbi:MAG: PIN domain-containing protein [Patescibacteria group bacterium]